MSRNDLRFELWGRRSFLFFLTAVIFIFSFINYSQAQPPSSWATFRYDAALTAQSHIRVPRFPATLDSIAGVSSGVAISPVVASDGTLIFTYDGSSTVYMVSPENDRRWEFSVAEQNFTAPPLVGKGDTVYIGSRQGFLYAFSPRGVKLWDSPYPITKGAISKSALQRRRDGTILVAVDHGWLYALSPKKERKWATPWGESKPASALVIDGNDHAYVAVDNKIYAFQDSVIFARWSHPDTTSKFDWLVASPNSTGDLIWAGSNKNPYVVTFRIPDGQRREILTDSTFGPCWPPALGSNGKLYVVSKTTGELRLLQASDGSLIWSTAPWGLTITNPPILDVSHRLFAVGKDNPNDRLYAILPDSNSRRSILLPGRPQNIIRHSAALGPDGTIYVPGFDKIYKIVAPYADSLKFIAGKDQQACMGTSLRDSVKVQVLSQYHEPVAGHEVRFRVVSGRGTLSDTTVKSDKSGYAKIKWQLGESTAPQKIEVYSKRAGKPLRGSPLQLNAVALFPEGVGKNHLPFDDTRVDEASQKIYSFHNRSKLCTLRIDSLKIGKGRISPFQFCQPDTRASHFIPPDDSLEVCVRFAPRAPDKHLDTLLIYSNDLWHNPYKVALEGTAFLSAHSHIIVSPESLDFGEVCIDSSQTDSLKITNKGTGDLLISQLLFFPDSTFSSPSNPSPEKPLKVRENDSFFIKVTFSPKWVGIYTAILDIVSNDPHPERDTLRVPLRGVGIGPKIGGEPNLKFNATAVKDSSTKEYVILNRSKCTLRIDSLAIKSGNDSAFYFCRSDTIASHCVEPDSSLKVCLWFSPQDSGQHIDSLFIYSSDSLHNPYKVALEGTAVPCLPEITVDPDSLDFGEVCIDSSKKSNLTILNSGCDIINVSLVSSDSAFCIEPDTLDLAPDSSQKVTIKFRPKLVKDYFDTLAITSNDSVKRIWQINLRGEGIGPKISGDSLADFDSIKVGEQKTISYRVINSGFCDLQTFKPVISGKDPSDFYNCTANGNWPVIIKPNESFLLCLRFTPGDTGWRNASMKIPSNDADEDSFEVQLRGYGRPNCSPPTVYHPRPKSPRVDSVATIEAEANGGCDGIRSLKLWYRQGGKVKFDTLDFINNIATIPKNSVTKRGVEYVIIAVDGAGNTKRLPAGKPFYSLQVRLPADSVWTIHPGGADTAAYRIRAFPLRLDSPSAKTVVWHNFHSEHLDRRFERLWDIDPVKAESNDPYREYPEVGNFTPGRAMFLITRDTITLKNTAGRTVRTDTAFVIPLHQGWNLVASPFNFEIPFENSSLDQFLGRACAYEGAWQGITPSFKFRPWEGVMIKARQGEALTILPSEEVLNTNNIPTRAGADWFIRINAFCRGAKDVINTIGVAPDATMEWDAYELLEPPPIGDYVTAYFSQHAWQKYPDFYTTDFRPRANDGYEWNFEVQTSIRGEVVKLQFENMKSLPPGLQVKLIDVDLNFPQDLRREPVYCFRASDIEENNRRFRLIVGKDEFIEKKLEGISQTPQKFELVQNFPNPFKPVTTIKFGLPKAANVSLIIYNVKGEVVRKLIDAQEKEARYHVVLWDGRDEAGKSVASGLYFYQLKAGDLTVTRKMIMAK